ncbi:MAG: hypothetical protein OXB86_04780 [Bdellovibrionales bacterium]|nr:hypothetical protein [Bdellovibrionales bacterium]
MSFNSMKLLNILTNAGVPEPQAKAQVQILEETIDSSLATKRDLEQMRIELKKDIELLRKDMTIKMGSIMLIGLGILMTFAKWGLLSIS